MEVGTIAQWVGALGTLAAVLVALCKEEFLRYWRRPELKASITLSPPDCHKTSIRLQDGFSADCYYLRLWVENIGKVRAEIIQVFATRLLRQAADRSFREIGSFLPMNLTWSHGGGVFAPGISPMMGAHCDLGRIIDPQHRRRFGDDLADVPQDQTILALDLERFPTG